MSTIRNKDGKLAITPGDWDVDLTRGGDVKAISAPNGKFPLEFLPYEGSHIFNKADGHLFAEAGTVTNATGRTPAELRDLVRELREVIRIAIDCKFIPNSSANDGGASKYSNAAHMADKIREAYKKSEGV
jgi:hypothetical protein